MKQKLTLKNTYISFTPSFMGQGWETSLLPKINREVPSADFRINLNWIGKLFAKMQKSGQAKEVISWTTVVARLFL